MDGRVVAGCVPRMGSAGIWLASSLTVLVCCCLPLFDVSID
jgi:hypothetical protein